jgi:hypothetical protein
MERGGVDERNNESSRGAVTVHVQDEKIQELVFVAQYSLLDATSAVVAVAKKKGNGR